MPTDSSTALTTGTAGPTAPADPPAKPQLLGQGLALEAVSQAAAMAVQDAGTYFRQIASVSAAAIAVFTSKMASTQTTEPWTTLIKAAGQSVTDASAVIKDVGTNAAAAVKAFTS